MKWGPLKADGRMAAKSAVKIRAALAQTADFKRVFQWYEETQPNISDNRAQDRARARAWVMLNVRVNMTALVGVLERVYAEGWVTGEAAADEAVAKAREAKKAADDKEAIDRQTSQRRLPRQLQQWFMLLMAFSQRIRM